MSVVHIDLSDEYNGFTPGERLIFKHRFDQTGKKIPTRINWHILENMPSNTECIVQECPNEGWPAECVQVQMGNGFGAIDITHLERQSEVFPDGLGFRYRAAIGAADANGTED